MKNYLTILAILLISGYSFGQICSGPAYGSVPSGIKVSLSSFQKVQAIKEPVEKYEKNKYGVEPLPGYDASMPPKNPYGSNFVQDVNLVGGLKKTNAGVVPIVLSSFKGIPDQGNQIPPDPYIAAGPEHVIATVNTRLRILDKFGNEKKTIEAVDFYRSLALGGSIYDPKITYDHFANRWVMVWLQVDDAKKKSHFLVSVSVDSSPLGDWYNYALPGNLNGADTITTWSDYQGVGYDSVAIYLTSNQFGFGGGSFDGSKIRIVDKAKLYSNTGGPVTWTDFWDLRLPTSYSNRSFGVRPSIAYTHSNDYYLMTHSAYTTGTSFYVYKISNPLKNPTVTGYNVPVSTYRGYTAPEQLGGSSIGLESGGFNLRNEPIFRDGFLYGIHSAANPSTGAGLQYIKIDTKQANPVAVEDYLFGSEGYYCIYPAMSVDKYHNVLITYSRTSATEYVGAFFTSRLSSDPTATFSGSWPLRYGAENYVKDFGSKRNRWGDYSGCWLDPVNQENFWTLTEYVEARNTWGTWISQVRLVPYKGAKINPSLLEMKFGNVEKNFVSDTVKLVIKNYGDNSLVISKIQCNSPYKILNSITYPLQLATLDSISVLVQFKSSTRGKYNDTLFVTSNDASYKGIPLSANCFEINAASDRILYASTGKDNNYNMAVINKSTGSGTISGVYGTDEINSITINPKTKIMYALSSNIDASKLLRVNATLSDAYKLYDIPFVNLNGMTFDTAGTLYIASKSGIIYRMNLSTGKLDSLSKTGFNVSSIAVNPADNQMWATLNSVFGVKDRIYKLNPLTGETKEIGTAGVSAVINAITFDESGKMYGTINVTGDNDNFFTINKETAAATLIGSVGMKKVTGMAYLPGKVNDVKNNLQIPNVFSLAQNYPNPFNPSTTISYSLPQAGNVKITIYNLLGESVKTIINESKPAGSYQTVWNSTDESGNKVVSGVYFYEFEIFIRWR